MVQRGHQSEKAEKGSLEAYSVQELLDAQSLLLGRLLKIRIPQLILERNEGQSGCSWPNALQRRWRLACSEKGVSKSNDGNCCFRLLLRLL